MSTLFKGKKIVDKQKLRGGYYTPELLATFLCDWAIRNDGGKILEPSCGDGNFICAALDHIKNKKIPSQKITAIEINEEEFEKAKWRTSDYTSTAEVSWINDDFFNSYKNLAKSSFDVVIGNPPFIRFQHFDDDSREKAFSSLREANYKPTKLANSWAAFVQLSIELLSPNGRLAMVVPAELLQVKYAAELRERITQAFEHVIIVTFKKLVFKDIQQEVVLLLAEGKRLDLKPESDIHTIEIDDEHMLNSSIFDNSIAHSKAKHARSGLKWTSLFLNDIDFATLDSVQKSPKITPLGKLASVDVGIVTGRNSFFVIDEETKNKYKLSNYVMPLIGKTSGLKCLSFDKKDYDNYKLSNPAHILNLKGVERERFNTSLEEYILLGEEHGVHDGFKCRVRKRWFDVPSTHVSDGFLFRQIHKNPLLVHNKIGAACTDTIHRVKLINDDINFQFLAASFVNSLTFAWAEVCGRSYGGGVLEIEPNEAEHIPIPYFPSVHLDTDFVDECIRSDDILRALDYVDKLLLVDQLGLSPAEVASLRNAWVTLRDRRIKRK